MAKGKEEKYTRRESNPNLKNRNLPFYPLNYGCLFFLQYSCKDTIKREQHKTNLLVFFAEREYLI